MPVPVSSGARWRVNLTQPPRVARVGIGMHGVRDQVERWVLPSLWSLHAYDYHGALTVGGEVVDLRPGTVTVVPPATPMVFAYDGPSQHLFAHLDAPLANGRQWLPLWHRNAGSNPSIAAWWRDAIDAMMTVPARAQANMWSVLWRLAEGQPPATAGLQLPIEPGTAKVDDSIAAFDDQIHHPAVAAAIGVIERHLSAPPAVPDLARRVGISPNHLTRLFHRELGTTVVGYVRRRRADYADHLLRSSTLPISGIAATVGIPDLQAFNKLIRRELGASPRGIRASTSKDGPGLTG